MPKKLRFSAFLMCVVCRCFGQHAATDSLSMFSETLRQHPQEKVYLHFDRQHYNAGDTVYFKAYTVLTPKNRLSPLSAVLYIDVLGDDPVTLTSLQLHLIGGMTHSSFVIPYKTKSGTLNIRAYTKWMLNEKQPVEFERLAVTELSASTAGKKMASAIPDISFMPEGGTLINSLPSKIAFKALGSDGMGTEATGRIVDDQNKTIVSFQTTHLGMGQFVFIPEKGKVYYADVTFKNGIKSHISLPAATDDGLAFKIVSNEPGKILLEVDAGADYFAAHKDEELKIVSQWRGKSGWFSGKLAAPSIRFQLKDNYPPGILYLTLLNGKQQPVCERLVFVRNEADLLSVTANTDKTVYHSHERVSIDILANDANKLAAAGSFSVSVTQNDTSKSIFSGLLLTSELRGYVEGPGNYFDKNNAKADADLDLVMLTHGYRHYTVKQFLAGDEQDISFAPEKGLTVAGFLNTAKGKVLAHKKVSLSDPVGRGISLDTLTDDKGFFVFKNIIYNDSTAFKISSDEYDAKITPFTGMIRPAIGEMAHLYPAKVLTAEERSLLDTTEIAASGKRLKEVKVYARKKEEAYETQSLAGAGNADQVVQIKNIQGGGTFTDALSGLLRGVTLVHGVPYLNSSLMTVIGSNKAKPMLVIIDGMRPAEEDYEEGNTTIHGVNLNILPLRDIKTVEILKSGNASIYGMESGGGVLVITTTKGEAAEEIPASELSFKNMGFTVTKEFYEPKYAPHNKFADALDHRKTVYWKPDVTTGSDGKTRLIFHQNGLTGKFCVSVNGISTDGKLGAATFNYTVTDGL